jgi:hypothetical protein
MESNLKLEYERYSYRPLQSTGRFRLLKFSLAENGYLMVGQLLERDVADGVQYDCLSYSCGTDPPSHVIILDGAALPITWNLLQALNSLRQVQKTGLVWIDAICINQQDLDERSQQIQIMSKIYSGAQHVIVYLGGEADGSQNVPTLCTQIMTACLFRGRSGTDAAAMLEAPLEPIGMEELRAAGLPDVGDPAWDQLQAFCRRPWFVRKWVIQETVLARSLTFICGAWSADRILLEAIPLAAACQLPVHRGSACSLPTKDETGFRRILEMKDMGLRSPGYEPRDLISLLDIFRTSCATDSRDHVYALLGLSKESKEPELVPDYREKVADTYCRYSKYLIRQGRGLDLLYCITGDDSSIKVPTWVPDWSFAGMPHFRFRTARGENGHFRAGGVASRDSVRLGRGEGEIIVSAIIIDTVEQRTPIRALPFADPSPSSHWDVHAMKKMQDQMARIILEMKYLLRNCDVYPTMEPKEDVIWRTAMANCKVGRQSQEAPSSHRDLYNAFEFITEWSLDLHAEMLMPLYNNPETLDQLQSSTEYHRAALQAKYKVFQDQARHFFDGAISHCIGNRRCLTRKGYLGHVPRTARIGDVICVIRGGDVPFVLRAEGTSYRLVGQSYLHGFMKGEATTSLEFHFQDISIV